MFAFDDRCRLLLERTAGPGPTAAWLMCNPSRASHLIDDPTALRVSHHSRRNGCPRSLVGNLWALVATDPRDLFEALRRGDYTAEMHRANLDALAMIGAQADRRIVAFGAAGRGQSRFVAEALEAFGGPLECLGTTADGYPLHPLARGKLAVRNDTVLRHWRAI